MAKFKSLWEEFIFCLRRRTRRLGKLAGDPLPVKSQLSQCSSLSPTKIVSNTTFLTRILSAKLPQKTVHYLLCTSHALLFVLCYSFVFVIFVNKMFVNGTTLCMQSSVQISIKWREETKADCRLSIVFTLPREEISEYGWCEGGESIWGGFLYCRQNNSSIEQNYRNRERDRRRGGRCSTATLHSRVSRGSGGHTS